MTKRQTPFFATQSDLIDLLNDVHRSTPISFALCGLFDEPVVAMCSEVQGLKSLQSYLIVQHGTAITIRDVPQRAGGIKYAIDQLFNPQSVVLQTGGLVSTKHLIAGQVGTVAENTQSIELYDAFFKCIRQKFTKIKSYHVGNEARTMLRAGARLSATTKSAMAFDLVE